LDSFPLTIGHSVVPGRRVWVGPTVFADGLGWVRPTGFDVGKMLWAHLSVQVACSPVEKTWVRVGANSSVQHQARRSKPPTAFETEDGSAYRGHQDTYTKRHLLSAMVGSRCFICEPEFARGRIAATVYDIT
jgi:hypothetical protein